MLSSRSTLWLLFNLVLGLAAGVALAWGPLAAPAPIIVALGLSGALLGAGVASWSHTKARQRVVWAGHGLIVLAVALAALIPLYRIGALALPGETHQANFQRLWRALDYAYPYFELKGIDPDALYAVYAPQAAQAESDGDYWRVTAISLSELNDGHTGLLEPSVTSGRRYFATCRAIDGAVVVDQVGAIAQAAGLARGDVVLAVNGNPVEEALDALPSILRAGSTPQQRRLNAALNLLSTAHDTLTVTASGAAGERSVTLVWPEDYAVVASQGAAGVEPLIAGQRLPSGLGLIRIPTFGSGNDLVVEFDAALDGLLDTQGLIIDLRGNGGGSTFVSDRIAARFFDRPFTYGRDQFIARLPQRGWRGHFDYRIAPRGQIYDGAVVLLIDETNFSTAEQFIVALVDSGRATTVGRPTAGGCGNPLHFRLAGGGLARFSSAAFYRNDGSLIEGAGIEPDLPAAWTVQDFRTGHDPDLAVAQRFLGAQAP